MSTRILTVLVISVLHYSSVLAQPENVTFRYLGPLEGLPSTSVSDITQDALGFIWVGTWDWVYRYDGRNFRKFPVNGGRYLTPDRDGGIWISAEGGAVWHYEASSDSLKRYEVETGRRFNNVVADDSGGIWITSNKGLMRLNQTAGAFELDQGQKDGSTARLDYRAGMLYFTHYDNKERQYFLGTRNTKGAYHYFPFPARSESPIAFSQVNRFELIALDTGTMVISDQGWAIKGDKSKTWSFGKPDNPKALDEMNHVVLDHNGQLWVNQARAVSRIDMATGKSIVYDVDDPSNGLPSIRVPFVGNMFIDRQGILWVTRFSAGLSRVNLFDSDFGLAVNEEGMPYPVLSAYELENGTYFLGTRSFDGLLHFNKNNQLIQQFTTDSYSKCPTGRTIGTELSHPFIWDIEKTNDGSLWLATGWPNRRDGGISRITPDHNSIVRFKHDPNDPSSIPGNWIQELLVDGSDRLWATMAGGGTFLIDPQTEEIDRDPFLEDTGLDGENWSAMMITKEGDIIIFTQNQQHYLVDHQTFEVEPFGFSEVDRQVMDYQLVDNSGVYWFIERDSEDFEPTGKFGSWNPKTGKATFYSDLEIFSQIDVYVIRDDHNGDLWLGTDNGLVKFTPEDLRIQAYEIERGLQGNLFSSRPSYRGPSGKIYLGGNGGVNIFHPDSIIKNPYPPDMVITDIKLDGRTLSNQAGSVIDAPVAMATEITVSPDIAAITIDFATIHFAGDGMNRSEYFLEGFDKDWRDGGITGNATYTNLPHGNYVFKIRGSNWDRVWSDGSKSIKIVVLPPWYLTWWAYMIYGLIFLAAVFGVGSYQRSRVIRKERERIKDRELAQAKEIEKAYKQLKETQTQLIHSEKMASLGELTAGIAHEIQNPLNFVNNFSEVNRELVEEMIEEMENGNLEEAAAIGKDIIENEDKVNHHGKRAEAIVKSMLQHSKGSSGEKEPTDINSLVDEYLRLAYHGFRAKDKTFNANFKTDLADDLPKINVVAQDIGRVVLNLVNNAFQAIRGVAKPEVVVATRHGAKGIEISVKDNGPGIPEDIREKIFQPFFTTKAAGEGTGLGLSLSYDIVTKGHGGILNVESQPRQGSKFVVQLPVNNTRE